MIVLFEEALQRAERNAQSGCKFSGMVMALFGQCRQIWNRFQSLAHTISALIVLSITRMKWSESFKNLKILLETREKTCLRTSVAGSR